jgi:3-phosphoshikimate 1-carboxyvinyltransferase
MQRVATPLSLLGADVQTTDGHPPVYINPAKLYGAEINLPISSAQVKSAVLLAGLTAEGETVVTEPIQSRDHTEKMLAAMGADIHVNGNQIRVKKSDLHAVNVCVPGDISSAAYYWKDKLYRRVSLCAWNRMAEAYFPYEIYLPFDYSGV